MGGPNGNARTRFSSGGFGGGMDDGFMNEHPVF